MTKQSIALTSPPTSGRGRPRKGSGLQRLQKHGQGQACHGSCSRVEPGPTKGAPHRRPQRLPLPHQGPTTTPALVARPRLYFAFQRAEFQTCSSCLSLPRWPLPCVASLTVLSPPASLRSLLLIPLSSPCIVPALSLSHTHSSLTGKLCYRLCITLGLTVFYVYCILFYNNNNNNR